MTYSWYCCCRSRPWSSYALAQLLCSCIKSWKERLIHASTCTRTSFSMWMLSVVAEIIERCALAVGPCSMMYKQWVNNHARGGESIDVKKLHCLFQCSVFGQGSFWIDEEEWLVPGNDGLSFVKAPEDGWMDAGWVSNLFVWKMQFEQIMSTQQQSIRSSGCNLSFLVAVWLVIYTSLFCTLPGNLWSFHRPDRASMKRFHLSKERKLVCVFMHGRWFLMVGFLFMFCGGLHQMLMGACFMSSC